MWALPEMLMPNIWKIWVKNMMAIFRTAVAFLPIPTKSALHQIKRHDMDRLYEQLHVTRHWPQ